jgi:hypothetical protein
MLILLIKEEYFGFIVDLANDGNGLIVVLITRK